METKAINDFTKFLESNGYCSSTIRIYISYAGPFLEALACQTQAELEKQINLIVDNNNRLSPPIRHSLKAALNQFFLMKTGIAIKDYRKLCKNRGPFQPLLDDLLRYLLDIRGYVMSSAMKCVNISKNLIQAISINGQEPEWSRIDARQIHAYIQERGERISVHSMGVEATCIRTFFKYLEYRGIEVNPSIFSLRITAPRQKNALIPKILSCEELDRARSFYATECERDVRNKAIVLSLIELGLRTSEVAGMMLDDIHWQSGYLTVRSSKTRSERVLPLPDELGRSYEKYILKYRPKSKSNHLFLRTGRNSGQAITTEQVRRIVRYMMDKTGLSSYWVGAHAFRRTLGSRLFNAGNGLKSVADMLGHDSVISTTAYAKVDIEGLRSIAADWPSFQGDNRC